MAWDAITGGRDERGGARKAGVVGVEGKQTSYAGENMGMRKGLQAEFVVVFSFLLWLFRVERPGADPTVLRYFR